MVRLKTSYVTLSLSSIWHSFIIFGIISVVLFDIDKSNIIILISAVRTIFDKKFIDIE